MRTPGVKLIIKDGRYYVRISCHGTRKQYSCGTNKLAAQQLKARFELEIAQGTYKHHAIEDRKSKELHFYCESWLKTIGNSTLASRTLEEYTRSLKNHVYPAFGKCQLDKISRGMVKDWIVKMYESGLSMSTIRNAVAPARIIFSYALDSELISNNVFQDQKILSQLKKTRPAPKVEVWTPDEVIQFLEMARIMYPDQWMIFFTALNTGCRLGELRGLLVNNFHLSERFIEVHQALTRTNQIKGTKTYKSKRVEISRNVADVLTEYLGQQAIKSIESGIKSPYAFHDEDGQPLTESAVQSRFTRICKAAGVRKVHIHSMRHYYASMLLANGASPIYTAQQLGHSTPEMVYRVYGHYIKMAQRVEIDHCLTLGNDSKCNENATVSHE